MKRYGIFSQFWIFYILYEGKSVLLSGLARPRFHQIFVEKFGWGPCNSLRLRPPFFRGMHEGINHLAQWHIKYINFLISRRHRQNRHPNVFSHSEVYFRHKSPPWDDDIILLDVMYPQSSRNYPALSYPSGPISFRRIVWDTLIYDAELLRITGPANFSLTKIKVTIVLYYG